MQQPAIFDRRILTAPVGVDDRPLLHQISFSCLIENINHQLRRHPLRHFPTDKLGAATASGDGGEGSPVETDPLGGSVGTSTPYIQQFNSGWEPSPEYPMLHSYFDDAPQYVNGQRVNCNLDGMEIGCSQAYHMLDVGSAIPAALAPFQNLPGFSFDSHGNGIFKVTVPLQVGWNANPNGSVSPVYSQFSTRSYTFSISWNIQEQTRQQDKNNVIELPNDLRERVVKRAGEDTDCGKAIERLINKVAENTDRKKKKETDIGSLFDKVGRKKIALDESLPRFMGDTGGVAVVGSPTIRIGPAKQNIFDDFPNSTPNDVYEGYAFVVIHELIHNSAKKGTYSDSEILDAVLVF